MANYDIETGIEEDEEEDEERAVTNNGYDWYELLSALQKCIRRGMEYESIHFAVEAETFNPTALWNHLKIYASEDIGVANPLMPILVETLEKQYLKAKSSIDKKSHPKNSHRLFLVNAVVNLCHSEKSRIVDDLLNTVYLERQLENKGIPIPEFALDSHTAKGRAKGRGVEFFFNESTKLENKANIPNPYTERARELLLKKELMLKHGKPT